MRKGGRTIVDEHGNMTRPDPKSAAYADYPKAEVAKDKDGNPLHARSVGVIPGKELPALPPGTAASASPARENGAPVGQPQGEALRQGQGEE